MKMSKNRVFHKRKEQKGVVLISVLIFLLLLSYFVRSSMSSAIVNEEKAGADLDLTIAREMTYLALQDAVHDMRSEDFASNFCGNKKVNCKSAKARIIAKGETTDKTLSPQEQLSFSTAFLVKQANIDGVGGLYNSEAQKRCQNTSGILPLWQCVDWGPYFGEASNYFVSSTLKPSIKYGQYTNAPFPYREDEVPKPRYIIEVFPGATLGLAKGYIARVTAVGFGRKSSDTQNAGVTNIMQQAVYVLE